MTPLSVSVIIPVYNTERYLREALESACAQIPAPFEVIVVDDGSTDASASIAEAFGGMVQCIRRSHGGISAARNAGLDAARGDVIGFLDADDRWVPNSLSRRLEILAPKPTVDCACGLVEQFISPELPESVKAGLNPKVGLSSGRVAGATLIRRAGIERIGRFDEALRVGETLDWVARADHAGVLTESIDEVVLQRRLHDANTGSQHPEYRQDYLRMLKASLDRKRARATDTHSG